MSAATKKPLSTPNRRPTDMSPPSSRTPSRSPSSAAANAVPRTTRPTRTGTPVSARAAMQRPGTASSKLSSTGDNVEAEEEARAENMSLIEELREKLHAAETTSEKYQKEALVLQSRLDESLSEQGKLEERMHEIEEKNEALENEKREALRQQSQMESIYEAERASMTKEREAMANREEEMHAIIQRLKDTLASRNNSENDENRDGGRLSRRSAGTSSSSIENGQFAPPSELTRSDSRNNSKLLLQKDKLIESLRLELAEAQIRLVETENMGGGRFHEIEKLLLETRMANARLMEDNESYQLLLQEKTLNGDFTRNDFGFLGAHSNTDALNALEGRAPASSLADELSEAGEGESDNYRRLEVELKASKDSNKALTLYINKIIERLLMHQDFEAILDQSSDFKPSMSSSKDKELPPPPQSNGNTMFSRGKSLDAGKIRPRPLSQMPATNSALTDPNTAPSIPFGLGRSSSSKKRRPMSEQIGTGAANVVNQMYRGPASPPLPHGPQTPRHSASFFAPPAAGGNPNAAARVPSGSSVPTLSSGVAGNFPGEKRGERSETSSLNSSGDATTPPSSSPPRSEKETEKAEKRTSFAGGKPRPLRLVQENVEKEETANKRASWFGWAIGKKDESIPE